MTDPIQRFNERNIARWANEPLGAHPWCKAPVGDRICNGALGHRFPWHTPHDQFLRVWKWRRATR